MKKLLIILLLFSGYLQAQDSIKYTPMSAAGYRYKYLLADSGFNVPFGDTAISRGSTRPGALICYTGDNLIYRWNGLRWIQMDNAISNNCQTTLIDGSIIWVDGFNFSNTLLNYRIGCRTFSADAGSFSITASDTTDRYTIIVADTNGVISSIDGTVGPVASIPNVDPRSQILLATYLIPANSTEPQLLSNTVVYKENIEWGGAGTFSGLDFVYTTNPYQGLYSTYIPSYTSGVGYFYYTGGSSYNFSDYSYLSFYVRLTGTVSSIQIAFIDGSGWAKHASISSGNYGLDGSLLNQYQLVIIPINRLTTNTVSNTFQSILFQLYGSGGAIQFDNIILQSGGNNQSSTGVTSVNGQTNAITIRQKYNSDSTYSILEVNGVDTDSLILLKDTLTQGLNSQIVTTGNNHVLNVPVEKVKSVFGGDSFSLINLWPEDFKDSSSYFGAGEMISYATSGWTTQQMLDNYYTSVYLSRPTDTGQNYIAHWYAGINDVTGSELIADTVWNHLKRLYSMSRADGYRVCAYTLIFSNYLTAWGGYAAQLPQWEALNDSILAHPELYDYIVNMAQVLDYRLDSSVYADYTHPNAAGRKIFAGEVARVLREQSQAFYTASEAPISTTDNRRRTVFSGSVGLYNVNTAQMNAIRNPIIGLTVVNTDSSNRVFIYNGTIWKGLSFTSDGGGGSSQWDDITGGIEYTGGFAQTGEFRNKGVSGFSSFYNNSNNRIAWFGNGIGDENFYFVNESSGKAIYFATNSYTNVIQTIGSSNVSIGKGLSTGVASSILEMVSTSKGVLAPRMTDAQMRAITAPDNGLFVTNTDSLNRIFIYTGSAWKGLAFTDEGALAKAYAPLIVRNDSIFQRYNILAYGAIPNDGIDDTEPIQAAINAAWATGGSAMVYAPTGKYDLFGPIITNVGGFDPNSQLYLPLHDVGNFQNRGHIKIMGEAPPNYVVLGSNSTTQPSNYGTIFYSHYTGTRSTTVPGTAILGGDGPNLGGVGNGDNVNFLTVENISFIVKNNPNGAGPEIGGVNGRHISSVMILNCIATVDTSGYETTLPIRDVAGFETSDCNNETDNSLIGTSAYGFKRGFVIGEHVTADQIQSRACQWGIAGKIGNHASQINKALVQQCKYALGFYDNGSGCQATAIPIGIDLLAVEWSATGETHWFKSVYGINDSLNNLTGNVKYWVTQSGVGGNGNANWVVNGAANMKQQVLGSALVGSSNWTVTGSDIYRNSKIMAGSTSSPAYTISIGSVSKGFEQYDSGNPNDGIKVVNDGPGATFGIQNVNSSGFSGIEYMDNLGATKVFTGYQTSTGDFRFNNIASGGTISLKIAGTNRLVINNSGTITTSAYGAGTATFDASGNITSVSDERLKTDIQYYKSGLKELMKLKPIQYKWNKLSGNETKETYAGFSAQNVKENIKFGTGENKDGYLSLQERAITATLVNSTQELYEMLLKQQKQIEELKAEIQKLKK